MHTVQNYKISDAKQGILTSMANRVIQQCHW